MVERRLRGTVNQGIRRPDFAWITPELAVGAAFSAACVDALAQAGIDSVLDLRAEALPSWEALEQRGLRALHVPVPDGGAPTDEQLWTAIGWIEGEVAQERGVLVHGKAGMGRSVLVVCALLVRWGATPAAAFVQVQRRRAVAELNERQWEALRGFWRSRDAFEAAR